MKKLLALLFAALLFVGCGEKTPEDVATSFLKAAYTGDSKAMVELIYLSDDELKTDGVKEMVDGKLQMMAAEAKSQAAKQGGFDKAKTTRVQLDGEAADVDVEVKFKNGEAKKESVKLKKSKDGWKVKL